MLVKKPSMAEMEATLRAIKTLLKSEPVTPFSGLKIKLQASPVNLSGSICGKGQDSKNDSASKMQGGTIQQIASMALHLLLVLEK